MNDAELWELFSGAALPADAWTHETHVRVAWLHLERWPLNEAHVMMRVGIIRLNAFHGLKETPERGYHETLTRTWLAIVSASRGAAPVADSRAFLERTPELLDRGMVRRFYTRDRIMGVEARARFVEPDVAPLPVG